MTGEKLLMNPLLGRASQRKRGHHTHTHIFLLLLFRDLPRKADASGPKDSSTRLKKKETAFKTFRFYWNFFLFLRANDEHRLKV